MQNIDICSSNEKSKCCGQQSASVFKKTIPNSAWIIRVYFTALLLVCTRETPTVVASN